MNLTISLMQRGQVPTVARLLSAAMLHTPIHAAVFGGREEAARLSIERMFVELFTAAPGITFLANIGAETVAVMRMKSCHGRRPVRTADADADVSKLSTRKQHWHNLWARHDPTAPHWHLGPIAVSAGHRRRGIGTALMRRFCREVDACRVPAYLETDTTANVGFYRKFGFRLVGREAVFGVTNYFMQRPAVRA